MACQRQHGDKVQLVIVLSDILQHLHHGRRGNQVMAGEPRTVGNNGVADINTRLLTQNLAYGIRTCSPGTWHVKSCMANHTENGIGNHVVRFFQHNLKQVVQRRRLLTGYHGPRLVDQRLAQQSPAVSDTGLF